MLFKFVIYLLLLDGILHCQYVFGNFKNDKLESYDKYSFNN